MKRKKKAKVSKDFRRKFDESICIKVKLMANALNEIPADMAKDIIFYMYGKSSFAGQHMDSPALKECLWELCRIRSLKGDGFESVYKQHEIFLENIKEYRIVHEKIFCVNMDMYFLLGILKNKNLSQEDRENVEQCMYRILSSKNTEYYWDKVLKRLCSEEEKELVQSIISIGDAEDNKMLIIACARLYLRLQHEEEIE